MNRPKRSVVCFVFLFELVLASVAPFATQFSSASASSSPEPFSWYHTFNFTNSEFYFGKPLDLGDIRENLRNYAFQLLYGDIETACKVSILDILLLRTLEPIIAFMPLFPFMGLCMGMSQAARDYYLNPEHIPLGLDEAYYLPPPNMPGGDVTESAIKEWALWKGSAAIFNPYNLLNVLRIYFGLTPGLGGTSNALEFHSLAQLMMKDSPVYKPVPLLLGQPIWHTPVIGPWDFHFVLAYNYTQNPDGTKTIYIYDPNTLFGEDWHNIGEDWITLSSDFTFEGTHLNPARTSGGYNYTHFMAYPEFPDYPSITELIIEILQRYIGISLFSPVELHITDPMGRTVGPGPDGTLQLGFPALYMQHEEKKSVLMPYAPNLPYQINLTGTDTGNYTLEINRAVNGQLVTKTIEGNITAGETDTYNLELTGVGVKLNPQTVSLSDPTGITADSMKLEWTPYTDPDFARYEIYQSTSWGTLGTNIHNITDASTTTYTATGLQPQTAYHYTTRVVDTAKEFADSNQVSGITTKERRFPDWLYGAIIAVAIGATIVVVVLVVRKRRL